MEDPAHRPPYSHLEGSVPAGGDAPAALRPAEMPRPATDRVPLTLEREKDTPRGMTAGPLNFPEVNQSLRSDQAFDSRIRYEKSARLIPHAVRNLASSLRSRSQEPPPKADYNPEPMPYQPKLFKSSTHLKMVPISRRHQDMYTEKSLSTGSLTAQQAPAKKPLIIHSDRYQLRSEWEEIRPVYASLPLTAKLIGQRICGPAPPSPRYTQRERMMAEQEYLDKVRSAKKEREFPSHRESRDMVMGSRKIEFNDSSAAGGDTAGIGIRLPILAEALQPVRGSRSLLMGGQKATFTQRYDIKDELRRLKSIVLPTHARELFHGKGIKLPTNHASLKPRLKMPPAGTPHGGRNQTPLPTIHRLFDVDTDGEDDGNGEEATGDSSPKKKATPNPLQGVLDLSEHKLEESQLRQDFQRLDTGSAGYLDYSQVRQSLPNSFNGSQEKYVRQVYDVTTESTSFGVQEFVNLQCLCREIEMLGEEIIAAYEKLEFVSLREKLIQYLGLFQSIDRLNSGKIKKESLDEILALQMQLDIEEDKPTFLTIQKPIKANEASEISRIKYVAHIPYFIQKEKSSPFTDDEDGPDDDEPEGDDRNFRNTLQNIPVAAT